MRRYGNRWMLAAKIVGVIALLALLYCMAYVSFLKSEHEYYLRSLIAKRIVSASKESGFDAKRFRECIPQDVLKDLSIAEQMYSVSSAVDGAGGTIVVFRRTRPVGFFTRMVCPCYYLVRGAPEEQGGLTFGAYYDSY